MASEAGTGKRIWREHDDFATGGKALTIAVDQANSTAVVAGYFKDTLDLFGFRLIAEPKKEAVFLIKFNSEKKGIWYKVMTSDKLSRIHSLEITEDGSILTGGFTRGATRFQGTQLSTDSSAFVMNLSSDGEVNWIKSEKMVYGGEMIFDQKNQYIYWQGVDRNTSNPLYFSTWIKKMDLTGKEIWNITDLNYFSYDLASFAQMQLTLDHLGNLIQGQLNSVPLNSFASKNEDWEKQLVITKYDAESKEILFQTKILSSIGLNNKGSHDGNMLFIEDMKSFEDGNTHLVGVFGQDEITIHPSDDEPFTVRSKGKTDIWFVKLNEKGKLIFSNWYGSKNPDWAIHISTDGERISTGGCYFGELDIMDDSYAGKDPSVPTIYHTWYEQLPTKVGSESNVDEQDESKELELAPNPAPKNGDLQLKLDIKGGAKYEIVAHDLEGKITRILASYYFNESLDDHQINIPLVNLKEGMYLLSVKANDQIIQSTKLVIQ